MIDRDTVREYTEALTRGNVPNIAEIRWLLDNCGEALDQEFPDTSVAGVVAGRGNLIDGDRRFQDRVHGNRVVGTKDDTASKDAPYHGNRVSGRPHFWRVLVNDLLQGSGQFLQDFEAERYGHQNSVSIKRSNSSSSFDNAKGETSCATPSPLLSRNTCWIDGP